MKKCGYIVAFVVGALGCEWAPAQQDKLPTGEDVMMRYVEATGGVSAYERVRSVRVTGTLSVPAQSLSGSLDVTTVKPNKMRAKISIDGLGEHEQFCDGEHCWEKSVLTGVRVITGDEASQIMRQNDLARIYNPKNFFKTMQNKGIEEINDEPCYKIHLVAKNGEEMEAYYSVETGLERKSVREQKTQMGDIKMESFSSDYRETEGLLFAMKSEQKFANGMSQDITIDKIEFNVDVPATTFDVPDDVQKLIDKAKAKEEANADEAKAA